MDVGLGIDRHVVVDHVGDVVDVDPPGGDVGGDEDRGPTVTKGLHRLGAGVLGLVPMDRIGTDRGPQKRLGKPLGTVLGPGEDECTLDVPRAQVALEQVQLRVSIDLVEVLRDRLHGRRFRIGLYRDRILQDRVRQLADVLGERGGEEQRLAFFGKHPDDLGDVRDESHVEHAIRFIEHEGLDLCQVDVALVGEVHEPAGGRHEHVDAGPERLHLVILAHTAVDHRMLERELESVGREALEDLHREFPRGAEHQRAGRPAPDAPAGGTGLANLGSGQSMQNRQGEGTGLSGTGLGATKNVPACECGRNRLLLDRGRLGVALGGDRSEDGLAEPQFLETHVRDLWFLQMHAR